VSQWVTCKQWVELMLFTGHVSGCENDLFSKLLSRLLDKYIPVGTVSCFSGSSLMVSNLALSPWVFL
jgi:hypothetical protein